MQDAGFDAHQLKIAGFTAGDLKDAEKALGEFPSLWCAQFQLHRFVIQRFTVPVF